MHEPRVNDGGTVGPVDGLQVPRFAGHSTFARLPRREDVEAFDVAVVGVPFDSGVTYRPGARFGPSHIRQGSRLLRPYNPALDVSPFAGVQVVDAGDIAANPFSIEDALEQIEAGVRELSADGRNVVLLGGDHTVTLPALRALKAQHGPIALVHFDAHLDTWDTYFDAPFTHGTPFRRAWQEGLLDADHTMHVGIRGSLYSRDDLADDASMGFSIVPARDLDRLGADGVVERVRERVGDAPVYISIDIDVLDPGFAPGTGTPEAGGLTSRELLEMVRGFAGAHVVGADVVEVSPPYDHAEITAIAAANLAYEYCSVFAWNRR
ncbi:agmatinase [Nocardioides sp.]|uniref:agmatinase n=1 Tax=Nocardioides sp. TaxID=35761 RepID=UPI0026336411|nr:agmatinase [Nocardioides sp.]MDI6910294.1 agmatinase [Nocardioides sp.]